MSLRRDCLTVHGAVGRTPGATSRERPSVQTGDGFPQADMIRVKREENTIG